MSVRFRSALALAAAAAVAVLSTTSSAVAAPAPPTTTTVPAAAAAGWLAQQFVGADAKASPSGDHFDFPGGTSYWGGLTASGVFALAAAKVGGDKIDSVLGYMKTNVASDALADFGAGPYDGSVATYALAAIVAGADPSSFGGVNLLQTLKDDECTAAANSDGSDYSAPLCPAAGAAVNIYSSVSESLAILAEARAGGVYAPSAGAVTYFLSLQCPNGGFTGDTNACTNDSSASADETAYAAQALQALGGHGAELMKATDWLVHNRNADGYWVVQGGPDVDSTGLAVAALDGAGIDTSSSRAWLASEQVTTGPTIGAGASRGALKYQGAFSASSSVKATADGLLGLSSGASLATLTSAGSAATAPVLALTAPAPKRASVQAGGKQTVTASGFSAGETVTAVLHSTPITLGTSKASSTGAVAYTFTVPATLATGSHTVVLTGTISGLSATSTAFTVTAAAPPATTSTSITAAVAQGENCSQQALACTGRDGVQTCAEVEFGVALLGVGLLAL
ncbi:MAG: hypothetical protein ABI232_05495, partial [Jatrophihabitantaceae bacterium]